MDHTDLIKSLEQIEAKKKAINAEANLTSETRSIRELDKRVAVLMNELRHLRGTVLDEEQFVTETCARLAPSAKSLDRTSQLFEIMSHLMTLNRLCKQIDRNKLLEMVHSTDNQSDHLDKRSLARESNMSISIQAVEDYNEEMRHQRAKEIIREFEIVYKPLDIVLDQRKDLPYVAYANKVKKLKESLARSRRLAAATASATVQAPLPSTTTGNKQKG